MTRHVCPYACSRCDASCPCTCREVLIQSFDDNGALASRELRCYYDLLPAAQEEVG